ncbi:hypothetical protein H671_2g7479 [Cricetulus griseus]|nr:hypothetical protein H671_2g7479 [Cricetulus griseus]
MKIKQYSRVFEGFQGVYDNVFPKTAPPCARGAILLLQDHVLRFYESPTINYVTGYQVMTPSLRNYGTRMKRRLSHFYTHNQNVKKNEECQIKSSWHPSGTYIDNKHGNNPLLIPSITIVDLWERGLKIREKADRGKIQTDHGQSTKLDHEKREGRERKREETKRAKERYKSPPTQGDR